MSWAHGSGGSSDYCIREAIIFKINRAFIQVDIEALGLIKKVL